MHDSGSLVKAMLSRGPLAALVSAAALIGKRRPRPLVRATNEELVCVVAPRAVCKITITRRSGASPFLLVRVRTQFGEADAFVPVSRPGSILIESLGPEAMLTIDRADVVSLSATRAGARDLLATLWQRSKTPGIVTLAPGVALLPLLHRAGAEARDLGRSLRRLERMGFGIGTANLEDTLRHDLVEHGPAAIPVEKIPSLRVAIVIHLYYAELWLEFEHRLLAIRVPFHLIVSTTRSNSELEPRIRASFPEAEIVFYENRGRDVGPFMELYREGRLDGVDLICKLHGKRTGASGPRALVGEVWRRAMLNDLIGSDLVVRRILDRFAAAPNVGLIGSRRFRFPSSAVTTASAWGANEKSTIELSRRIGLAAGDFKLDYFAGTMFWVRRRALDGLASLSLSLDDFPPEEGQEDGTLQHAMERLFGALPSCVGMDVEDTQWTV
jgi:hypothetical protein